MYKQLMSFLMVVITLASMSYSQDADLENVLNGARLLFIQNETLYYMEIGKWEKVVLHSPCANGSAVRWAASGKRALIAAPSSVTVIDIATEQVAYSKTGLSINNDPTADPAADISYDGTTIFFAQGNNIKALDIASEQVTTIYTTSSANQITEGELCVSENGKRFAGRKNNAYAVFVDIEKGLEGQYAEECSPAISPSGTILAVNQDGHQNIKTYKWTLDAAEPVEWRIINIAGNGKWDNQTWSNHEDYYVGNGDGGDCKIVNVQTEEVYNFGHATVCLYPDLWVPSSAGGIVPTMETIHSSIAPARRTEGKNTNPYCRFSPDGTNRVLTGPGISRILVYSLSGRKIAEQHIQKSSHPIPVSIGTTGENHSMTIIQQLP